MEQNRLAVNVLMEYRGERIRDTFTFPEEWRAVKLKLEISKKTAFTSGVKIDLSSIRRSTPGDELEAGMSGNRLE